MGINTSIEVQYHLEETIDLKTITVSSDFQLQIIPESLKLRTDIAEKSEDGMSVILSGVMLEPGSFKTQVEGGSAWGYFEYKPDFINTFDHINVKETKPVRLSTTRDYSWKSSADHIDSKRSYQYRACIRIKTETGIFYFYGRTYTLLKSETLELSGLELSETFVDARDLSSEAGLVDRGLEKLAVEKVESWNEKEFKQWVWQKLNNTIDTVSFGFNYMDYNTMSVNEMSSLLAALSSLTELELKQLDRSDLIIYLNKEINELSLEKIDQLTDINLRFLCRILTVDTKGVYRDWITSELKCILEVLLFDTMSFEDFLASFPFGKWNRITKQKLNLTETKNTSIEVEYLESGPYQYLRDFNIGDIIAVEYPGIFKTVSRVVEVEEIHTEVGKKYRIVLGRESEEVMKAMSDKNNVGNRL